MNIQLQIILPNRNSFSLQCNDLDTISEIKQKIYSSQGIFPDKQLLIFNGTTLSNEANLKSLLIANGDEIFLFTNNILALFIVALDSDRENLVKIDKNATLSNLMDEIKSLYCYQEDDVWLIHNDIQIDTCGSKSVKLSNLPFNDGDRIKIVHKLWFTTIRLYTKSKGFPKKSLDVPSTMTLRAFLQQHLLDQYAFHNGKLLTPNDQMLSDVGLKDEDVLFIVDKWSKSNFVLTVSLGAKQYNISVSCNSTLKWISGELTRLSSIQPQSWYYKDTGAYAGSIFRFNKLNQGQMLSFHQYNNAIRELQITSSTILYAA